MKHKIFIVALLFCTMTAFLSACGSNDGKAGASSGLAASQPIPQSSQPEDSVLDVMCVPLGDGGEGGFLYFDQAEGADSALTLQLPEDLRDENGEPITREDLNRGDILRLRFSQPYDIGETWPGQLFTEANYAQVIHRGKPEDADQYQEAVDAFYHPDPLWIPYLQFTHIDGMAACGGSLDPETESYEWDCTDENGEPVHLSHQAEHPLLRKDIPQISLSGPFPLELALEKGVLEWEVRRWEVSQKGDEGLPEGELVTPVPGSVTAEGIDPAEDTSPGAPIRAVVEDAAPGQIYQVTARWEQGWVSYGFELCES